MRLSEAMRLGAMSTLPASIYETIGYDDDGHACRSCAIGAVLVAVGIERTQGPLNFGDGAWGGPLADLFPIINFHVGAPPVVVSRGWHLGQIASALFQTGWTREAIADWVESIERAHEPVIATEQKVAIAALVPVPSAAQ